MKTLRLLRTALAGSAAVLLAGCATPPAADRSFIERLAQRRFPAVFQAWNPIDMPQVVPLTTLPQRLAAAARHGLLWEEPVSQLGFGTPLVLGLEWAGPHAGLSREFTADSLRQARANRAELLRQNPAMLMLLEVRWRDAPGSFLPADSPFWKRAPDGSRAKGWDGGPEPYYLLNPDDAGFLANVAEQALLAVRSGVYDGIMLDWSGHPGVVKAVREAIGPDALIIVNIHDSIADGQRYAPWINGAFMECGPPKLCTWQGMSDALRWFERNLRVPQVNALEVWGERADLPRMRAATAMSLTHGNGFVLYGDPNPLKTPDHLHDWYPFWDVSLGRPLAAGTQQPDGSWRRDFERGTAVYNPEGGKPTTVRFTVPHKRASTGEQSSEFSVPAMDGEVFMR